MKTNNNLTRRFCIGITSLALLGVGGLDTPTATAAETSTPEVWITGDVFSENEVLLFKADKPIKGNSKGSVVLLGAPRGSAESVMPILLKLAEKKMKARLYGYLQPAKGGFPGKNPADLPNIAFVVWKIHMPDEPDELPPNQRIQMR